MHTNVPSILENFEEKVGEKYKEWLNEAEILGVNFILSALPGFDDRAVREGNRPLPKGVNRLKFSYG